jgi:hypothetical protein
MATVLAFKEMVVGLSYRVQNGKEFDRVFEYKGPGASGSGLFTCKYGAQWTMGLRVYDSYTLFGPVPKDTLTEAELQHQRDLYARYCAYAARAAYYDAYCGGLEN